MKKLSLGEIDYDFFALKHWDCGLEQKPVERKVLPNPLMGP